MSQGQMQACHADSLHHRGLMRRDKSCQNTGAAVSSSNSRAEQKKSTKTHTQQAPFVPDGQMNAQKDTSKAVLYST